MRKKRVKQLIKEFEKKNGRKPKHAMWAVEPGETNLDDPHYTLLEESERRKIKKVR